LTWLLILILMDKRTKGLLQKYLARMVITWETCSKGLQILLKVRKIPVEPLPSDFKMRDLEFKHSVHSALKRSAYPSGSRAKSKREWQKGPRSTRRTYAETWFRHLRARLAAPCKSRSRSRAAAKPAKERSTNDGPCQWALNGCRTLLSRARNQRRRERKRPDATTRRAPAYVRARARREWDITCNRTRAILMVDRQARAYAYVCMCRRSRVLPACHSRGGGDSSPRNAHNIAWPDSGDRAVPSCRVAHGVSAKNPNWKVLLGWGGKCQIVPIIKHQHSVPDSYFSRPRQFILSIIVSNSTQFYFNDMVLSCMKNQELRNANLQTLDPLLSNLIPELVVSSLPETSAPPCMSTSLHPRACNLNPRIVLAWFNRLVVPPSTKIQRDCRSIMPLCNRISIAYVFDYKVQLVSLIRSTDS